jgi:DnaJ-class molecular chaperone
MKTIERCSTCEGTGFFKEINYVVESLELVICPVCDGSGEVEKDYGDEE